MTNTGRRHAIDNVQFKIQRELNVLGSQVAEAEKQEVTALASKEDVRNALKLMLELAEVVRNHDMWITEL